MRTHVLSMALACVLMGIGSARGQNPSPSNGVHIDTRVEDERQLAALQDLEAESRWDAVIQLTSQLLSERAGALIAVEESRYEPLSNVIQRRMAVWPTFAIETWRAKYNQNAAEALADCETADPACWQGVVDRWWLTPAATEAADRLAVWHLEGGRFSAAVRLWEQLASLPIDADQQATFRMKLTRARAAASRAADSREPASGVSETLSLPDSVFWQWAIEPPLAEPALRPTVEGRRIFAQSADRIWCIDRLRGGQRWDFHLDWLLGADLDKAGEIPDRGARVPVERNGSLFAVMGEVVPGVFSWQRAEGRSALLCLDAEKGDARWHRLAAEVIPGDGVFFDGNVILHAGVLHVIVRRWPTVGFEEVHLARLAPQGGRVLSTLRLAGGAIGDAKTRRMTRCDPVAHEDDVFIDTRLGVLACLSATTGRLRWMALTTPTRDSDGACANEASLALRLVTLSDSNQPRLLSVDPDMREILLCDIEGGRVVRRISGTDLGRPWYMLGPVDDVVFGVGDDVVAYDLVQQAVQWRVAMDGGACAGGPCLTEKHVWVPTAEGLHSITLDGAAHERSRWSEPRITGGHLASCDGFMLVSSPTHITACGNADSLWRRLRERIDDVPDDPERQLDFAAYALHRSDQYEPGLLALDTALDIAGPAWSDSKEAVAVRAEVFDISTTAIAVWLSHEECEFAIEGLLDRSARTAATAAGQVHYRLAFGAAYDEMGDAEQAVELYQQILDDRGLRVVALGLDRQPAGKTACDRLDRLISEHGRAAYSRHDSAADALYVAGQRSGDPVLLREVIERYPNALVIGDAMLALARSCGESDSLQTARYLQNRLLARPLSNGPWSPEVVREVASCYRRAGLLREAVTWLARGRFLYTDHRFISNGSSATFHSLLEQSATWRVCVEPAVLEPPVLEPPLRRAWEYTLGDEPMLITGAQVDARLPVVCSDRNGLTALDAARGCKLWSETVSTGDAPGWISGACGQIVLSTSYRLFALNAESGAEVWSIGQRPVLAGSPAIDPEILSTIVVRAADAFGCMVVFDDGQALAVSLPEAEILWQRKLDCRPGRATLLTGWEFVYADPSMREIVVVDRLTGVERRRLAMLSDRPVQWLGLTAERSLLAAGGDGLGCWDLDSGLKLWSRDDIACQQYDLVRVGLGTAYVPTGPNRWIALDLQGANRHWSVQLDPEEADVARLAWLDEECLYVLSDKRLACIDRAQGGVTWTSPLEAGRTVAQAFLTATSIAVVELSSPYLSDRAHAAWITFFDRHDGRERGSERLELGEAARRIQQIVPLADGLLFRSGHVIQAWLGRAETPATKPSR